MMSFQDILSPQRQAHAYAVGMLWLLTIGTLATIALGLFAFLGLVELAQLLLTAMVESCAAIGQTFQTADSFTRVIILVFIGLVLYRAGRRALRRS
jgi:hypothetical protein